MEKHTEINNANRVSKIERIAYILVILFLSFSFIREAVFSTGYLEASKNLEFENSSLKKSILKDSSTIYSMQVKLAESFEIQQSQKLAISLLKIKEPTEVVKWRTRFIYKTSIDLGEPEIIDSIPHLKLPKKVEKYEKWFSINGEIDTRGTLNIDSMVTYANFTYAVGDTLRSGFVNRILNRKDKVVRLHVDNPNLEITGMENIYLRDRKKWHQTDLFKFGLGLLGGLALDAAIK